MIRRFTVGVAVLAVIVGSLNGWRRYRNQQVTAELKHRLTCPKDLGSTLPPRRTPRDPAAPAGISLVEVAELAQPLAMSTRPGDPSLYVAEKEGRVLRLQDGRSEVAIDLSNEVTLGREQGLLGLAFSPDGRFLYTNHTDLKGDTNITEWVLSDGAGEARRRRVMFVDQPHQWHNGGHLAFGPDGMLYVGLGDGGAKSNLWRTGQDVGVLLGKMLRIDPRPAKDRPYTVPRDNPLSKVEGARPEIWAYGLRNPWRFSFDSETGELWIADVGDGCFEEIDFEPGGFKGGANYGWKNAEGVWIIDDEPPGYVPPIYSYRRDGSLTCAIVGGFVYRGAALPALRGWYVFGDFCHGDLMVWQGPGRGVPVPLGLTVSGLSSFGVDQAGELYAMSLGGELYRFSPSVGVDERAATPRA